MTTNCSNSHIQWNSKHELKMTDYTNDVYFNIIKKVPGKDSFRLHSSMKPNYVISNFTEQETKIFNSSDLYQKYDIAEIIRSDYSRLFFDIDVDNGIYTPEELDLTYEQINLILDFLRIPSSNLNGVIEVSSNKINSMQDKIQRWTDKFHELIVIPTPYNNKEFSAHLYVSSYYFNRDSLFNLFSQGRNHYCKDPLIDKHFSSYIDQSVYVRQGAQKVFRFALSGKAMKNRPAPPFTPEQLNFVHSHLDKFICTKIESDSIFIAETSPEFDALKTYLSQFKGRNAERDCRRMKKQDLLNEIEDDILQHDRISKKYIAKQSPHAEWYHSLILQIKNYLVSNSTATDDDLFNEFSKEDYQYFSNSNNRKLYQPSSIRSAIEAARKNPYISIEDIIDFSSSDLTQFQRIDGITIPEFHNKNNCLQYTIEEFKAQVQRIDGITIPELCKLIHFTFIFFTRSDSEKSSILSLLYTETQDKKIVVKTFEEFQKQMKTSPIIIRLLRQITKTDKRKKEDSEENIQIMQNLTLFTAFDLFDNYKQRFYDYRVCAYSDSIFSLYSNPTSPDPKIPTSLPPEIDTILNIISTELSEEVDSDLTINTEKKEYILDWFAYILQHPESRNAVCLQISTLQGVGKNLLSNAVCDYLTHDFSEPSKDIEKVIGTYNGGIDKKLLIVMNEVDNSQKNTDLLKAIITEDTIQINVKYGLQYTGLNCASYLIYTNHIDTNTISNGDRRFTFIKSYGLPMPKEFYASICIPGKEGHLKPEIQKQFINHLLSRDLSNYRPNKIKDFDKDIIEDKRHETRSSIHKCLVQILTSPKYPKDYIIVSDFIKTIQLINSSLTKNAIAEKYGIPELNGIDDDIRSENLNRKKEFTTQSLNSIVNFEDDDLIEKIKSKKRDESRDKYVIRLRRPKSNSVFQNPGVHDQVRPCLPQINSVQNPSTQIQKSPNKSWSSRPGQASPSFNYVDPFSGNIQTQPTKKPKRKGPVKIMGLEDPEFTEEDYLNCEL